ncbi:hypothetical protein EC835_11522 [Providencia alcalifaciens]|uniref:Uncharacterized protein n=1 Tax=Providencia alcalifaciens TaxID=126385 RepID=A0A4R3NEY6_9GAMM|nr:MULTISPECIES: hypothetical protein [Providencia]MBC5792379.1 hypothetical protein [Providencia sp. JUb39]TCT28825.1 hypothetical protein EC835_11522 [Providencia alcalifaciens]
MDNDNLSGRTMAGNKWQISDQLWEKMAQLILDFSMKWARNLKSSSFAAMLTP